MILLPYPKIYILLVESYHIKTCNFGLQDDNDLLRRSPGTPVFTAPECCLGQDSVPKGLDYAAIEINNKQHTGYIIL